MLPYPSAASYSSSSSSSLRPASSTSAPTARPTPTITTVTNTTTAAPVATSTSTTTTGTTATHPATAAAGEGVPPLPGPASPHKRGRSVDDDQHHQHCSPTSTSPSQSQSQSRSQNVPVPVPEDQRTRKRRAATAAAAAGGPSSRGVANLTPEQLAKKRANDREAQRAIRERTRNQIETLEKRVQELTSQQPYQELQAVIRQKEAVEAENAEIRGRLASIMALIQPVLSGQQARTAYASPASTFVPSQSVPPTLPPPFTTSSPSPHTPYNIPTPSSATSPVSTADSPLHHSHAPSQSSPGLKHVMLLNQQRQDLYHGLDISSTGEQLKLDFLLGPSTATARHHRISRIRTGVDGPQDSPAFQHLPMKHDWNGASLPPRSMTTVAAAASRQYIHHGGSNSGDSNSSNNNHDHHTYSNNSNYHHSNHSSGLDHGHEYESNTAATNATPQPWIDYSNPFNNCAPTCPLDRLLLDFLRERQQRRSDGWGAREVLGPRYPSVSSLLNPARSAYAHPLSKVFTDVLSTFPGLCTLPERVAVLYIMFLAMRWQVDPSPANYDRMPAWIRPTEAQRRIAHPAWVDYIPFPLMRERLVRAREEDERERERERQRERERERETRWGGGGSGGGNGNGNGGSSKREDTYLFEDFFIPFTGTVRVGWPYADEDALLLAPDGDEVLVNPVFERHLRRLENWSLGPEFHRAFPALEGTYRLNVGGG
ncbi:hypothetical protein F4775DRAFT_589144 [Biscogniauxia sp. FL1348]|nr:hypothetical protein F4775DRAFT_589144 [Biscogniauxia sp. FL1348]